MRNRGLCAALIVGLLPAAANAAAGAASRCRLPDVADVEAKLDSVTVPKGTMPARRRVRYYDLANGGTLIVGEFLAPDAARDPDLSEYEEQRVAGADSKVHLGCGPVYAGGKGECPILDVRYDVRARRIINATCAKVMARHFE